MKGEGILNMRNNNGDIYNSISDIPQAVFARNAQSRKPFSRPVLFPLPH